MQLHYLALILILILQVDGTLETGDGMMLLNTGERVKHYNFKYKSVTVATFMWTTADRRQPEHSICLQQRESKEKITP